jgi:hypothetical protein
LADTDGVSFAIQLTALYPALKILGMGAAPGSRNKFYGCWSTVHRKTISLCRPRCETRRSNSVILVL